MTLRLTLPAKYISGPAKDLVKLFVDHYNKKHEIALAAEDLHVKIVGGDHLGSDVLVSDTLRNGVECYLMGKDAFVQPTKAPSPLFFLIPPSGHPPPTPSGCIWRDFDVNLRANAFSADLQFCHDFLLCLCVCVYWLIFNLY